MKSLKIAALSLGLDDNATFWTVKDNYGDSDAMQITWPKGSSSSNQWMLGYARSFHLPIVYKTTAPFVSKISVDFQGRMSANLSPDTPIAATLNGRYLADFYRLLAPYLGRLPESALSENLILHALLQRRGIVAPAQVAAYEDSLTLRPHDLLEQMRRHDSITFAHR